MPINVNGVYHPKIMVTFFRNNLIHIINLKGNVVHTQKIYDKDGDGWGEWFSVIRW